MEAAGDRDPSLKAALVLAGTAMLLYSADQITKAAVSAAIPLGGRVPVIGDFVQLWHARNAGAAFSLLPGELWLFLIVTAAALVMIVYFHRSLRDRGFLPQVLLGMILAGTLGNLTDRVRQGYVVDFISVGIGDLRWPTFNLADSSLVVGILLLLAYLTITERSERRGEAA